MADVQTFPGTVEKGIFIPESPADFKMACCLHEGHRVIVSIEKQKKARTSQQNRYYFGIVLKVVSLKTGYTVEELHDVFKLKFNSTFKKLGSMEERIPQSTASLKTDAFSEYIENIKRFAAEELDGIYIPDAGEV